MLPSLRALVFPMAHCSTSSAQNCKRLRSYIEHNCALPDADDLAPRAQNFKIADLPMPMIWLCARKNSKLQTPDAAHQLHEHKNPDFVLEKPENEGSEAQKSTKTPVLCSGREVIGIGNSNRSLPVNHRARSQNANTS